MAMPATEWLAGYELALEARFRPDVRAAMLRVLAPAWSEERLAGFLEAHAWATQHAGRTCACCPVHGARPAPELAS